MMVFMSIEYNIWFQKRPPTFFGYVTGFMQDVTVALHCGHLQELYSHTSLDYQEGPYPT
jgi:hypothetical protein